MEKKIWLVGYIEYNSDSTRDSKIYKDIKPFTDEVAAMVAHRDNILELAGWVCDGEDAEVADEYYYDHQNDTHIIENVGDDIVNIWIEEHKININ